MKAAAPEKTSPPTPIKSSEELVQIESLSAPSSSPSLHASSEVELDEEMALLKSMSQANSRGGNKVWTADGKHDVSQSQGGIRPAHTGSRRMPNVPPPLDYKCNRCGKKGQHYIAHCPTNNDHSYDRPKGFTSNGYAPDGMPEKSVGVPQPSTSTIIVKDLTGVDTQGKVVVQVKDGYEIHTPSTNQFDSLVSRGGAKSTLADLDLSAVPPPLKCPFSGKLLRDAVSTPCCHRIVSDEGYRQALFQTQDLQCPLCERGGVVPDELLPHKETKNKVEDFLLKVLGPLAKTEDSLQDPGGGEEERKESPSTKSGPPPPPPPPPLPPGPPQAQLSAPPMATNPPMAGYPPMNVHGPPPMLMNAPPMHMGGPPMHNMPVNNMGPSMGGPNLHPMGGNFFAKRQDLKSMMSFFDNGPFPRVWDLPPMTLEQFQREQGLQRAYFEEQAAKKRMGEFRQREPFVPNRRAPHAANRRDGHDGDIRGRGYGGGDSRRYGNDRRHSDERYDDKRRYSRHSSPPPRGGRDRDEYRSKQYRDDKGESEEWSRGPKDRRDEEDRHRDDRRQRDRDREKKRRSLDRTRERERSSRHNDRSRSRSLSPTRSRSRRDRGQKHGHGDDDISSRKRTDAVDKVADQENGNRDRHRDRDRDRDRERNRDSSKHQSSSSSKSSRQRVSHESHHDQVDKGKSRRQSDGDNDASQENGDRQKSSARRGKKRAADDVDNLTPDDGDERGDNTKSYGNSATSEGKNKSKSAKVEKRGSEKDDRHPRPDGSKDSSRRKEASRTRDEKKDKGKEHQRKSRSDEAIQEQSSRDEKSRKHKKPRRLALFTRLVIIFNLFDLLTYFALFQVS